MSQNRQCLVSTPFFSAQCTTLLADSPLRSDRARDEVDAERYGLGLHANRRVCCFITPRVTDWRFLQTLLVASSRCDIGRAATMLGRGGMFSPVLALAHFFLPVPLASSLCKAEYVPRKVQPPGHSVGLISCVPRD